MSVNFRIPPLLRVPPPLLFVLTFLAGAGVQRLLPLGLDNLGLVHAVMIFGKGLVALGVLLALCCVVMFLLRRTTLIPFGNASRLLTEGPYRYSRNPMYVSLVLVYLGVAVILGQLWPMVLLPLPVLAMQAVVIPFEEGRMQDLFGDEYTSYCARVRRWL